MANMNSKSLINNILKEIAKERPVFHSEADFQHVFAMRFMQILSPKQIRLERRFITKNKKNFELDMFAQTNSSNIGIELKYPSTNMKLLLTKKLLFFSHILIRVAIGILFCMTFIHWNN